MNDMQEHNNKGLGMGQGNFLGTSVRAFQVLEKGEGKKRGFQRLTAIISQMFIFGSAQDKCSLYSVSSSLCNPTTYITHSFYTKFFCFEVFVSPPEPGNRNFVWLSQTTRNKLFPVARPRFLCPALCLLTAPSCLLGKYCVQGKGYRKPWKGRQIMNHRI